MSTMSAHFGTSISAVVACLGLTSAAPKPIPETRFTTFRVTPITYPGVTNMDSGDAAGDVMFGLEQMLLPQLCQVDPDFLWCQNRKYLSGGSAWMVYSEFEIASRDAFAEYQACNPCSGHAPKPGSSGYGGSGFDTYCPEGKPNGTFVCQSYSGNSGPIPPQCDNGFRMWHQDCLNGTIYKTLTDLKPEDAEGTCCAACSADKANCAGWNMPGGVNGTTCQLMKEPLIMWNDGQTLSTCKAAIVDHDEYDCWYNDPYYKSAFAGYCDPKLCHCNIIEEFLPVGRELSPMCHRTSVESVPRVTVQKNIDVVGSTPNSNSYWSCSHALESICFNGYMPSKECSSCAAEHKTELDQAGCTPAFISHLCDANFETCEREFEEVCGRYRHSSACGQCLEEHTVQLEKANCTATFADYACSGGGTSSSKWEKYIDQFSCLMNGTWYSTAAAGQCKEKKLTADCWWYIAEEKRTVNASCVDQNVVSAVKAHREDCWTECPDNQGSNVTSACYLTCLFETLLGNSTTGLKGMTRAEIIEPFVKSFASADPSKGGCPDVK